MKISDVSSRYGAPMGRTVSEIENGRPIEVERVHLDNGGYDSGGAYWGAVGRGIEPLYRAVDDGNGCQYFRAATLAAAIASVREQFPGSAVTETGLSDFAQGAIEAAFFTANPLPRSGEYCCDLSGTWEQLDESDRARFLAACSAFLAKHGELLERACELTGNDMATAGRDYHYTSAGHGCGFWDGGWAVAIGSRSFDCGDLLTKAAKAMPLPEIVADLNCEHYHETGEGCGDCDGCEAGPAYFLE